MNEILKQKKIRRKKRASSIKIYIKNDDFKLNLIPIPFWLSRGFLSFIFFFIKIHMHYNNDLNNLSKQDVNEIFYSTKKVLKEIKRYPPFNIVEVKTKDTIVLIKTK